MKNLEFKEDEILDIIGMGRIGVDLNANEVNRPLKETMTFTKSVGGSPANLAVGAARLGLKTGFIGRVSDDQHGEYILNYFKDNNIDISNIKKDNTSVNGLAFTEIRDPSNCDIIMYRDNVADLKIDPKEINEEYIKNSNVLLISGTALSKSPSREAVLLAVEYARKNNTVVAFDIDYRPYSWVSKEETAIYYNILAEKSDIIIGTREEFNKIEYLLMPENNDDSVTAQKWINKNAKIVVVKHGEDGSIAYTNDGEKFIGGIYPAEVVNTFGAGDSYAAAFLYSLIKGNSLDECLKYGSAAAAIVISKHTCSEAMPTVVEIKEYIKNHSIKVMSDNNEQ